MKRILVVEDDSVLRENMNLILEEDYSVVLAEDGNKAIEILEKDFAFDLIISDVMMPNLDGYGLFKHIKESDLLSDIPFVFLSALADHRAVRKGMVFGADDYITKPFTIDELLMGVKTRIEKNERSEKKFEELKNNISLYVPHELRTPLVSILGNSDLISSYYDEFTKAEIIEMSNSINRSGKRLKRSIEKFLKYTDLTIQKSNGFGEIESSALFFSSRHNCKSALSSCYDCANRLDDISLNFKNAEIKILQEDFENLIMELVSNACKFSEKGTTILVNGEIVDDKYVVVVTDNGRGISKENINRFGLFSQFGRKHYQQDGNGIGLTIAKLICEKYNINISIESEVDKFTTVTLEFEM